VKPGMTSMVLRDSLPLLMVFYPKTWGRQFGTHPLRIKTRTAQDQPWAVAEYYLNQNDRIKLSIEYIIVYPM
jgi:hypothetical protein